MYVCVLLTLCAVPKAQVKSKLWFSDFWILNEFHCFCCCKFILTAGRSSLQQPHCSCCLTCRNASRVERLPIYLYRHAHTHTQPHTYTTTHAAETHIYMLVICSWSLKAFCVTLPRRAATLILFCVVSLMMQSSEVNGKMLMRKKITYFLPFAFRLMLNVEYWTQHDTLVFAMWLFMRVQCAQTRRSVFHRQCYNLFYCIFHTLHSCAQA